ncbi:MAG: hypothetical protein ACW98Y_16440 [Candidatus Thorarchaeota archaeon]
MIDSIVSPPSFIYDVISRVDIEILSAIMSTTRIGESYPTVKDIQNYLKETDVKLRRTQIYYRLDKLRQSGFLLVNSLGYPRKFRVDAATLVKGIKNCIEEKKQETIAVLSKLEQELDALDCVDPQSIVKLLKNDL